MSWPIKDVKARVDKVRRRVWLHYGEDQAILALFNKEGRAPLPPFIEVEEGEQEEGKEEEEEEVEWQEEEEEEVEEEERKKRKITRRQCYSNKKSSLLSE
ncbi:hypothetical protein PoB_007629600 [Plakobranchus ocellatus]|uniref:Uncharacterized protein n=1 Tax=Plakobranchus ocellatus TaxID=259542 RepID=A0AAV4E0E9_9GAST|nr:hypothetical protein PoB_007629600 [Plakobranchus ocellatus]